MAAQEAAGEHVAAESKEVLDNWELLKSTSLPALNRKLSAAGLPAVNLEQKPENMP